jgi:predicted dienelactone hydrolase
MSWWRWSVRMRGILLWACGAGVHAGIYDPLAVSPEVQMEHRDLGVVDARRQREIPIRVYLAPEGGAAAPVVLFSHGLGGSREGNGYLGRHWAARGYAAVFLQHPGSDSAVWREAPPAGRLRAMQQAASGENLVLRVEDVVAVLDGLERWNEEAGHALAGRLDLGKVGMSGHSFGAVTAQALGGQRPARGARSGAEPRIAAALMMSPSSPRFGSAAEAFGRVSIPWMLMTGTRDVARIGGADMKSRLAVFPALPPGGKYELVLFGGEHSAFTDLAPPGERASKNSNHHRVILALGTAFWDAHLRGDAEARAWLEGEGPRSVMEGGDSWQTK